MPGAASIQIAKRLWLVSVAVGRYADPAMPELPGVARDANRLDDILRRQGDAPRAGTLSLFNADATREGIFAALETVAREALEADQVVIYFGGHGYEHPGGDSPMPDGRTRYLLPHEGTWHSAAACGISTRQLAETLRRVRASEVVLILDCCHSGGLTTVFWPDVAALLQGHKSRYVLAAARHFQEALETDRGSPLTQSFCDALEGRAPVTVSEDGRVSAAVAGEHAIGCVRREAQLQQHAQEALQFALGSIYLTRLPAQAREVTVMRSEKAKKSVAVVDLSRYRDIARSLEQQLGANAVAELNRQIKLLIDSALGAVGVTPTGVPYKPTGDGAIVVLHDAGTASNFAEKLHLAARRHNLGKDQELAQRHFRVGICTGEIVVEPLKTPDGHTSGFEIHGLTISDAVRHEGACRTGEVLICPETWASLPDDLRRDYTAKQDEVKGKRGERFHVHRRKVVDPAPWDTPAAAAVPPTPLAPPAPLTLTAFGKDLASSVRAAADRHVHSLFGELLGSISNSGERARRQQLLEHVTEQACAVWLKLLETNIAGHGYDPTEVADYRESAEKFAADSRVAEELLKPILDEQAPDAPDVLTLMDAWKRLDCRALPEGFEWKKLVVAYRRQVQKLNTPQFREVLNPPSAAESERITVDRLGMRPEPNMLRYAERIRKKYRVLDLSAIAPATADEGGGLLLQSVFVPQHVRADPPPEELPRDLARKLADTERAARRGGHELADDLPDDELSRHQFERVRTTYVQQPPRSVLEVLTEPGRPHVMLVGFPGSGKSTLTRYLLLSALDAPINAATGQPETWTAAFQGHLPLLIELRHFIAERAERRCSTFLGFLDQLGRTQGYHLNEAWLDQRLRSGPALVLFDGLDEIFDPKDRDEIVQQIIGFVTTYPKARVVVTTRPVGYRDTVLKAAGFQHFAIQDLDDPQVETFVRGWFARVFPDREEEAKVRTERILKAATESRSIRLLAGNPMLLTIMALIARQQELPRERWRFYEHSADVLCHHWDVNRHLKEEAKLDADYIGLEDKKELLRRIAWAMQAAPKGLAGNFIDGERLRAVIEGYFVDRYRHPPDKAKAMGKAMIGQLRERNYILCLYGADVYGFVHRTLLEYFCADELVRRLEKTADFPIEKLRDEVFAAHWRDPAWQEVLRLVCGMVGESYADQLIRFLTGPAHPVWPVTLDFDPPRHLVLAVQCLGEVRNLNAVEDAARELSKTIFRLFQIGSSQVYQMVTGELLPATAALGTRWPGRDWLAERFAASLPSLADYAALSWAAQLMATLFSDRPAVRDLLISLSACGHLPHRDHFYDVSPAVRSAAVSALASGWAQHAETLPLVRARAVDDPDGQVRRAAAATLAGSTGGLKDRWLLSRDLDGIAPFLDPLEPVSQDHVRKAAKRLGMTEERIVERLVTLSQLFGWKLLEGARPAKSEQKPPKPPGPKGRKRH